MRTALAVLILSIAGSFVADDKAAALSWCAISNQGAANCGFASIDKCREEVAGNGGSCIPEAPVGHPAGPQHRASRSRGPRAGRTPAAGQQKGQLADLVQRLLSGQRAGDSVAVHSITLARVPSKAAARRDARARLD